MKVTPRQKKIWMRHLEDFEESSIVNCESITSRFIAYWATHLMPQWRVHWDFEKNRARVKPGWSAPLEFIDLHYGEDKKTLVHYACDEAADPRLLGFAMRMGLSANVWTGKGMTAVATVCMQNDLEKLKTLAAWGTDIDVKLPPGQKVRSHLAETTLTHRIAMASKRPLPERLAILKFLTQTARDPHALDATGRRAVDLIADPKAHQVVSLILADRATEHLSGTFGVQDVDDPSYRALMAWSQESALASANASSEAWVAVDPQDAQWPRAYRRARPQEAGQCLLRIQHPVQADLIDVSTVLAHLGGKPADAVISEGGQRVWILSPHQVRPRIDITPRSTPSLRF